VALSQTDLEDGSGPALEDDVEQPSDESQRTTSPEESAAVRTVPIGEVPVAPPHHSPRD
jgi:hypothetical protein